MEQFSEKSEKPTPKRLKKAKKEARFAYSSYWGSSLFLFFSLFALLFLITPLKESCTHLFSTMSELATSAHPYKEVVALLRPLFRKLLFAILALLGLAFLFHSGQGRFLFSFSKPKGGKARRGYRLLFTLITWTLFSILIYFLLRTTKIEEHTLFEKGLFIAGIKMALFFLVFGFIDYLFQRHFFTKEMQMTKEEVQEEVKEEKVAKRTMFK